MTREKLVGKVATATGTKRELVDDIMLSIMTVIKKELNNGGSIYLRGFGTFSAVERAAKSARNISTGETMRIPARIQPVFRPVQDWKDDVAKGGRVRDRLAYEARKKEKSKDIDNNDIPY